MVTDIVKALTALKDGERLGALISVIEGPGVGSAVVLDRAEGLVSGDGAQWLTNDVRDDAFDLMDREENRALMYGDRRIFVDTVAPPPIMMIFGAGHIAQPLSLFARELGFRVVVADARGAWATSERFPNADELVVGWPDVVFAQIPLDRRTYVVLLSHDSRFEIPVFKEVHGKPIRYLGAMGSRRTHQIRVDRLKDDGWSDEEIAEIHGPIGLDLKAKSPAETAIAILGEIIRVRYWAGSALSLRGTDIAIHAE